jgi:hypothetical protein
MSIKIRNRVSDRDEFIPLNASTGLTMEWYSLTEFSRKVLNDLIAFAGMEKLKEQRKPQPDLGRIKELTSLYQEAHLVSQDGTKFESIESMHNIISHYQDVLEKVKTTT